jgi:hypothetical protein
MAISLRVFFIPLILLIGIWFVNRIALRARIRVRKIASEFCYLMCFTILGNNVVYFMGAVTFRPLEFWVTIGPSPPTVIMVIFTILISLGLVYSHEIPFIDRENTRTRKETFAKIWKPVLVHTLVIWFVTLVTINSIVLLSLTSY